VVNARIGRKPIKDEPKHPSFVVQVSRWEVFIRTAASFQKCCNLFNAHKALSQVLTPPSQAKSLCKAWLGYLVKWHICQLCRSDTHPFVPGTFTAQAKLNSKPTWDNLNLATINHGFINHSIFPASVHDHANRTRSVFRIPVDTRFRFSLLYGLCRTISLHNSRQDPLGFHIVQLQLPYYWIWKMQAQDYNVPLPISVLNSLPFQDV